MTLGHKQARNSLRRAAGGCRCRAVIGGALRVFALATHGCSLREFQRLCNNICFQVATSAHVYLCTHLLIYNVVIKRYIDVDVYVFEPRQTRNRTRIQVCLPISPNLSSCLTQSRSSGCDLSTAVLKLSMLGDVVCFAHICTH
jgi:hypothetical protein